jgi:hypothetical protein
MWTDVKGMIDMMHMYMYRIHTCTCIACIHVYMYTKIAVSNRWFEVHLTICHAYSSN